MQWTLLPVRCDTSSLRAGKTQSLITLKMVAIYSSETSSLLTRAARRHIHSREHTITEKTLTVKSAPALCNEGSVKAPRPAGEYNMIMSPVRPGTKSAVI
jgi:hypothetical protein